MSAVVEGRRGRGIDYAAEVQVYEPHRAGLPPLGAYLRELWRRRHFVLELSRANLRAQHFNTFFGQLWLILNPLFLALVLMALVTIVRGGSRGTEFLAHLMLCLFAFRLVSGSVSQGAKSVTSGGKLILNSAFPRSLLPLAAVVTGFMRFVPTLLLFAIMFVVAGLPVGPHMLWSLPIFGFLVVFGLGTAMLMATAQVYFRDLANFLPYFTRIWLYASPIIYYAHEVPERFEPILWANPLFPMLASLSEALAEGKAPTPAYLGAGLAWAVGALVVGFLVFVSREREFAVRL
ncbi:MAG TPA: ABC transporter permease [Gaiellaceae bacterium]|nr:ABC transporter permease [Gaiellaceae bacterium]